MDHTVLPANTPCLPFLRSIHWRSPPVRSTVADIQLQLTYLHAVYMFVQMKYYSDCHRTYSDLCARIDGGENVTTDSLNRTIQQKLAEIRALSITTTDSDSG